jgi:hypothetical protein
VWLSDSVYDIDPILVWGMRSILKATCGVGGRVHQIEPI